MPATNSFSDNLPFLGGIASAATGIIGSYISQNFSREMYQRQLSDSLKYSDPSFIMARYKNAGLNPHLIYGNTNNSHVQVPNYSAPNFEGISNAGGNFFSNMINLRTQNAQLEAIKADIMVKNATAKNIEADTDSKLFNTQYQAPANVFLTYSQENKNRKEIQSITDNWVMQNKRFALDERNSLFDKTMMYKEYLLKSKEANSRIKVNNAQIRHFDAVINNLQTDGELKQTEINLRKFGATWNDPTLTRILALGINDPEQFRRSIRGFNNLFKEVKNVYNEWAEQRRLSINNPIGKIIFDILFPR